MRLEYRKTPSYTLNSYKGEEWVDLTGAPISDKTLSILYSQDSASMPRSFVDCLMCAGGPPGFNLIWYLYRERFRSSGYLVSPRRPAHSSKFLLEEPAVLT